MGYFKAFCENQICFLVLSVVEQCLSKLQGNFYDGFHCSQPKNRERKSCSWWSLSILDQGNSRCYCSHVICYAFVTPITLLRADLVFMQLTDEASCVFVTRDLFFCTDRRRRISWLDYCQEKDNGVGVVCANN